MRAETYTGCDWRDWSAIFCIEMGAVDAWKWHVTRDGQAAADKGYARVWWRSAFSVTWTQPVVYPVPIELVTIVGMFPRHGVAKE